MESRPNRHSESNYRWRENNPAAWQNSKKQYYKKSAKKAFASRRKWTPDEIQRVTDHNRPCDRVLAKELGRSMKAVQQMRGRARSMKPF
jgi:hypothetical protein